MGGHETITHEAVDNDGSQQRQRRGRKEAENTMIPASVPECTHSVAACVSWPVRLSDCLPPPVTGSSCASLQVYPSRQECVCVCVCASTHTRLTPGLASSSLPQILHTAEFYLLAALSAFISGNGHEGTHERKREKTCKKIASFPYHIQSIDTKGYCVTRERIL